MSAAPQREPQNGMEESARGGVGTIFSGPFFSLATLHVSYYVTGDMFLGSCGGTLEGRGEGLGGSKKGRSAAA